MKLQDRFWSRVRKTGECWEWAGACARGYGYVWFNGRLERAHRMSWILHFGPIPDGMCVLHKCDNGRCVRPDHLFLGSQDENMKDMCRKGRGKKIGPSGEDHGNSKLTWDAVREIRRIRSEAGMSQRKLAVKFGVSLSLINKIVRNIYWKDVR